MGIAKAKTINLLLYEGDLGGVISIEDSSWNAGELYSAPRNSVEELLETGACSKYGVYLLLSQEMVYVGQSSDLAKRITQHKMGKDWWESVVILTTNNDSLNHSDIDYLESILIDKALRINRLDCDNKKKGSTPKVDKFRKVYLRQYLEEALFLMQLIGINIFNETKTAIKKSRASGSLIETVDVNTKLAIGKRAKAEAISFLKESGFAVGKNVNYAVKQGNRNEFWMNPVKEMLSKDWEVILNNNEQMELIYLQIPRNTFNIAENGRLGFFVRTDKNNLIDLNINAETLIDKRSGINFFPYIIKRIKYGN